MTFLALSIMQTAIVISAWPHSMFNDKEVVFEKLSSSIAIRPGHITQRFRDGPSWKGSLLRSRNLLHFIEGKRECSDGKVICLCSRSKFMPELGLKPRPLDSSSSVLSTPPRGMYICGI